MCRYFVLLRQLVFFVFSAWNERADYNVLDAMPHQVRTNVHSEPADGKM